MIIDNIKIENFKSLENVSLGLKRLNLLTGINSSGKSSVIQVLLLIKQNMELIQNVESIADNVMKIFDVIKKSYGKTNDKDIDMRKGIESLLLSNPKKLKIKGDYVDLGLAKNLLYEEAVNDVIKMELSKDSSSKITFECDLANNPYSDSLPCKIFPNSPNELMKFNLFDYSSFQYLNAERVGPKHVYKYSQDVINKNSIGNKGEFFAHFLAENKNASLSIKSLKHENTKTDQLLENASAWLSKISNGIDIKPQIDSELKQVKLTYTYFNKTKELFPQNIGFGITYVLPIIVAILKSKPGDLLILENPEAHLHPAGQAEIGNLCAIAAEEGVQIIVETHSDHFLNGVRVAVKEKTINAENVEIYYFDKEVDKLSTKVYNPQIGINGKIDKWPKGFFDEWDNQLDKLLW